MKRLFLIAIPMMASIMCGAAHANEHASISEIRALSDTWIRAEISHDRGTLDRVLDERFLATLTSGKTITKAAYINWITSDKVDPFEVVGKVITVYGNTALVIGVIKDDPLKVTWVAVRKGGLWRAISLTFSSVSAPK